MRPLKIGKNKEKYYTPGQTIKESDNIRREKAVEISKNRKETKPIKYLIKK